MRRIVANHSQEGHPFRVVPAHRAIVALGSLHEVLNKSAIKQGVALVGLGHVESASLTCEMRAPERVVAHCGRRECCLVLVLVPLDLLLDVTADVQLPFRFLIAPA